MALYHSPEYQTSFDIGLTVLEKQFNIHFQDDGYKWPSWISNWNDFSYIVLIYKWPQYFLQSFKSIGLSLQEMKFKIDFQDGHLGSHVGFLIKVILAFFFICRSPNISY